jgi:anti-anti-sigma factor
MTDAQAGVEINQEAGRTVIRIHGEVDMANADTVGEQIRAAARPSDAVDLDLRGVTFFDSSGLRMLNLLSDAFEQAGGRLTVIAGSDGIVGRLLAITHMDTYLHLRDELGR